MFDQGKGPPVVVVPGVQGRWEWGRPGLLQMARRCRTISYSLCGDLRTPRRIERTCGFDAHLLQLDDVLDAAGLERAVICGVSFGGYIALRYAARRPERVTALVLASAPGPGWTPNPQQVTWLARPWLSAPGFVVTSPLRVWPEISAAIPPRWGRARFLVRQALRCAGAPMIPPLVAARIRMASTVDFDQDCARVRAATLVLSGEEALDRVVPVSSTRAYASRIPRAEYMVLEGTGHMGMYTQPVRFAEIVTGFVHANHH